jgi:hypothetical protein
MATWTFFGCVFIFAPDGTAVAASVNKPGSWGDSFIAENSGIYDKLKHVLHLLVVNVLWMLPFLASLPFFD